VTPTNYELQGYNINDILFHRVSWNDIVRLKNPNREPIKPLLNIYHAQLVRNYDETPDSETQSQNENNTGYNESNIKEQEDNQEESNQIEQVGLEAELKMNEEINQENGKEQPPKNNVNNGKTVISYSTEDFCPPKKKKYKGPPKVITNSAWVNLGNDENDENGEEGVDYISASPATKIQNQQQDKPPFFPAPFLRPTTSPRRPSPRKKANQEEVEPISGHSRNLMRSDGKLFEIKLKCKLLI
jgi:hypothetical protein